MSYCDPITRLRKFSPLPKDHHLIGDTCHACNQTFKEGEITTLVALGPGDDPEARRLCREGNTYNAIAIPIHWSCATGEVDEL